MKTKPERMHDRSTKIKRRRKMIGDAKSPFTQKPIVDGKLANGHEVSAVLTEGRSKKTNTRKAHDSGYRFKGGFGEANKYSPHDLRQILRESDDPVYVTIEVRDYTPVENIIATVKIV